MDVLLSSSFIIIDCRRLPGIEQILNVFLTIESSPDFALRSIESFSRKLRKKMGQPVPTKVELEQNKNK